MYYLGIESELFVIASYPHNTRHFKWIVNGTKSGGKKKVSDSLIACRLSSGWVFPLPVWSRTRHDYNRGRQDNDTASKTGKTEFHFGKIARKFNWIVQLGWSRDNIQYKYVYCWWLLLLLLFLFVHSDWMPPIRFKTFVVRFFANKMIEWIPKIIFLALQSLSIVWKSHRTWDEEKIIHIANSAHKIFRTGHK